MTLGYYIKALLSSAIIVGILYAIYLKLNTQIKKKNNKGNLHITDRLWIQKGQGIIVVEYRNSDYLLSVTEHSISLIKELSLNSEKAEFIEKVNKEKNEIINEIINQ
jgi:hypothetical protein